MPSRDRYGAAISCTSCFLSLAAPLRRQCLATTLERFNRKLIAFAIKKWASDATILLITFRSKVCWTIQGLFQTLIRPYSYGYSELRSERGRLSMKWNAVNSSLSHRKMPRVVLMTGCLWDSPSKVAVVNVLPPSMSLNWRFPNGWLLWKVPLLDDVAIRLEINAQILSLHNSFSRLIVS